MGKKQALEAMERIFNYCEEIDLHIPEPVKMLWKTKRLHTKQKQVILPLLKGE